MKPRYAIHIGAIKYCNDDYYHGHNLAIVTASSEDEAVGFGHRVALEKYPVSGGWRDHACIALLIDDPRPIPSGGADR